MSGLALTLLLMGSHARAVHRPPALIGHWRVEGSSASLTLCKNGIVTYQASDEERRGRWSVRRSELLIRFDYSRTRRFRFRLNRDTLTVRNLAKGPASPMKRADRSWHETDE